jgi:hypothetical protein
MTEKREPKGRGTQERIRCQIGHFPGRPSSSCTEPAKMNVDGLVLCDKHALEAKLEGQIFCWDEMLFHIDLWSREASRQNRAQIVELLDDERAKAASAMERAYEDLDLARCETSRGEAPPGSGELLKRGSLPLPPKAARPLSPGLRRLRRR